MNNTVKTEEKKWTWISCLTKIGMSEFVCEAVLDEKVFENPELPRFIVYRRLLLVQHTPLGGGKMSVQFLKPVGQTHPTNEGILDVDGVMTIGPINPELAAQVKQTFGVESILTATPDMVPPVDPRRR